MNINRRQFFRIPIYTNKCVVKDNYKSVPAEAREVSAGGMSLTVNYDVFNEFIEIEFILDGEKFSRLSKILRRKIESSGRTLYSVQFLNFTEQERAKLNSKILKLDALSKK